MEREKIDKLFQLVEKLRSSSEDKRVLNCATIIEQLLVKIDDLLEENDRLKEENESLAFDLQDKRFERGARSSPRSNYVRWHVDIDGDVPF